MTSAAEKDASVPADAGSGAEEARTEGALADHDRPREHAKLAALKGGAWGHVRDACRPVTTSHVPEFRYYFIGFRCCKASAP
jgi:formylglycine-generating enzyme required for sulfatase activity